MAGFSEKFRSCIMTISYQERRKTKLECYRRELARLREMEDDEIYFEYVSLKTEYEHRKNIITIFMLSIVIAVLMDTWKYFFSFVEKIMKYVASGQANGAEIAKVVFVCSVLIVIFITMVVFGILIAHTKQMYELNKKLMIVEKVMRNNDCD